MAKTSENPPDDSKAVMPELLPRVKEELIELQAFGGSASASSSIINGKLLGFIIKCHDITNISIVLDEYPEITIFEKVDCTGTHYIPIKVSPLSPSGEKRNYQGDHFYLNNKLRITINGSLRISAAVLVRWE